VDHLYEHKPIQTKFTKNCDNKRRKRKALINKLITKGLARFQRPSRSCVLWFYIDPQTMHKDHNTKNFDNKKEKQGFHLSQIEIIFFNKYLEVLQNIMCWNVLAKKQLKK
jgi:hypothetical protein